MKKLKNIMFNVAGFVFALALVGPLETSTVMAEVTANQKEQAAEIADHDNHKEEANHDDHDEEEGHDEGGHDDHGEEEGGDGHEGHGEHEEEEAIRLDENEIREFNIEVRTADSGQLQVHVNLSGEVVVNPDRLAHIVPRVSGVTRSVYKQLGDQVQAGEVLAVLESRELSEIKSAYLVGRERMAMAEVTFVREEKLWNESISSEREFLDAQKNLAEARIEMRAAEQKLHALGFSKSYIEQLSFGTDGQFTRYEMVAPFDGTIVAKHISLGEMLKDDAEAFIVADLSTVWVNFTIYQSDLPFVYKRQGVRITAGANMPTATGQISYVSPIVDEATRTAWARVVLPNQNGKWRPGTFVNGKVAVDKVVVEVVVPKTALQTVEDRTVVFVETDEGFEPHPVVLGRANDTHVEITSGLIPDQRYVARGSFVLKAQLAKGAFGDGHNH